MEAHYMFDVPLEGVSVVYHPENVMRAMATFRDGTTKAIFAPSDPCLATQSVLFPTDRLSSAGSFDLSPATISHLTFEPLDLDKFGVLCVGLEAAREGGTYPAVVSAANTIAVELFLTRQIGLQEFPGLLRAVMAAHQPVSHPSLEDILEAERWAQEFVGLQVTY